MRYIYPDVDFCPFRGQNHLCRDNCAMLHRDDQADWNEFFCALDPVDAAEAIEAESRKRLPQSLSGLAFILGFDPLAIFTLTSWRRETQGYLSSSAEIWFWNRRPGDW